MDLGRIFSRFHAFAFPDFARNTNKRFIFCTSDISVEKHEDSESKHAKRKLFKVGSKKIPIYNIK